MTEPVLLFIIICIHHCGTDIKFIFTVKLDREAIYITLLFVVSMRYVVQWCYSIHSARSLHCVGDACKSRSVYAVTRLYKLRVRL